MEGGMQGVVAVTQRQQLEQCVCKPRSAETHRAYLPSAQLPEPVQNKALLSAHAPYAVPLSVVLFEECYGNDGTEGKAMLAILMCPLDTGSRATLPLSTPIPALS